jgi:hypothetical protein
MSLPSVPGSTTNSRSPEAPWYLLIPPTIAKSPLSLSLIILGVVSIPADWTSEPSLKKIVPEDSSRPLATGSKKVSVTVQNPTGDDVKL